MSSALALAEALVSGPGLVAELGPSRFSATALVSAEPVLGLILALALALLEWASELFAVVAFLFGPESALEASALGLA